jgi:hypothetical protein
MYIELFFYKNYVEALGDGSFWSLVALHGLLNDKTYSIACNNYASCSLKMVKKIERLVCYWKKEVIHFQG